MIKTSFHPFLDIRTIGGIADPHRFGVIPTRLPAATGFIFPDDGMELCFSIFRRILPPPG